MLGVRYYKILIFAALAAPIWADSHWQTIFSEDPPVKKIQTFDLPQKDMQGRDFVLAARTEAMGGFWVTYLRILRRDSSTQLTPMIEFRLDDRCGRDNDLAFHINEQGDIVFPAKIMGSMMNMDQSSTCFPQPERRLSWHHEVWSVGL